jgi:hypothetical protein
MFNEDRNGPDFQLLDLMSNNRAALKSSATVFTFRRIGLEGEQNAGFSRQQYMEDSNPEKSMD